tara:strand:+ start:83 stop:259 length:177 start_codon:yes stop_codon:yes gene_type:complete
MEHSMEYEKLTYKEVKQLVKILNNTCCKEDNKKLFYKFNNIKKSHTGAGDTETVVLLK